MRTVLFRCAVDSVSGYGNDGIGIARSLGRLGVDVHLSPVQVTPPIPEEVALLLTKFPDPPFDVALVHVDPAQMAIYPGTRRASRLAIAWSMWEYESLALEIGPVFRENIRDFDALLSYDEVTRSALNQWLPPELMDRHFVLQGGYASEDWEFVERDWSGTFRYGMVGQLHDRKDPFAAIAAFTSLKQKHGDGFDAEVHLKTNIPGLHSSLEEAYPGVKVHYAWWSHERLEQFYASCHAYLAPSRGEGKNVPALEAQSTGIPVIGTNWGGHTVWMREDWSYPVAYNRSRSSNGLFGVRVDPEDLERQMWAAYSNRGECREKGYRASQTIPSMCDWDAVMSRFRDIVGQVEPRDREAVPLSR